MNNQGISLCLNKKIYDERGRKCEMCGKKIEVDLYDDGDEDGFMTKKHCYIIDHIKPRALDGGNEKENLQVLCYECNAKKTGQDLKNIWRKRNDKQKPR